MDNKILSPDEKHTLQKIQEKKKMLQAEIEAIHEELKEVLKQIETLGIRLDCEDPYTQKKNLCIKTFNYNYKKGVECLLTAGIIGKSPENLADFFLQNSKVLNKRSVGGYLGEISLEFNRQVLEAFLRGLNFEGTDIVTALRQLFSYLSPPGEAQKINHLLESFGRRYYEDNPNDTVLISADECYIMAISIIMVNTSLHNPQAKAQPVGFKDEQSYINGLAEYGDSLHVPESMIRQIFNEVKNNPIGISSDGGISEIAAKLPNAIKKGYLWKLGGRIKNWKRRWFILTDLFLSYYLTEENCNNFKGMISLEDLEVATCQDKNREFCLELTPQSSHAKYIKAFKCDSSGRSVEGHHLVYRIAASSASERDEWIAAIQECIIRINDS